MADEIQARLLEEVADLHGVPEGAYNIRTDGETTGRGTTANIDIVTKTDCAGIEIRIKPGTRNESVHIPVVLSKSGIKETVYNDFFIGEDCDVVIIAGCGISNCGQQDSQHDGVHRFYVGKNSKVKYVEKHYGEGDGLGKRIMNPGHGSVFGRKQPGRDGDGADQRGGFHRTDHESRTEGGREPGGKGEAAHPWKPERGEQLYSGA